MKTHIEEYIDELRSTSAYSEEMLEHIELLMIKYGADIIHLKGVREENTNLYIEKVMSVKD